MKKRKLFRSALDRINPYIPGSSIKEIKEKFGVKEVIKMASNENPLGVSPLALNSLPKEIRGLNYYPWPDAPDLRGKLAKKLGLGKDQIIIGNGSDELMSLAALAFLNPGDRVLVPFPGFQTYDIVSSMMEAEIIKIPFKNHEYDLSSFLEKIDDRVKIIFLCNPNNPTGTMFSKIQWMEFIKKVPDDVLVLVDEAYSEYVASDEYPEVAADLNSGKAVLILRTFSKIYGLAGLRVGYGLARPDIIAALQKVRLPFSVNLLAQKAAEAALDDEEFVVESRRANEAGKKYLYAQLAALNLKYLETQANFIYMDVEMNAQTLADEMAKLGVIVRPLGGFGLPKAIRVTVGRMDQNERFILALTQCLDWLR